MSAFLQLFYLHPFFKKKKNLPIPFIFVETTHLSLRKTALLCVALQHPVFIQLENVELLLVPFFFFAQCWKKEHALYSQLPFIHSVLFEDF